MSNEEGVRAVLESWAKNTRLDRKDDILANHARDVIIYDVLPPMMYEGTEAYRRSWDEWQPETVGETRFELRDIKVIADERVAFAFGMIECAGTKTDGTTFEDTARATFCLRNVEGRWLIVHQHISMPLG